MKVGDLVHTINPKIHGNHGIIVEWRPSYETASGHFFIAYAKVYWSLHDQSNWIRADNLCLMVLTKEIV